jgi:hypothetical protein
MQSTIALSTTETEYIALSTILHDLIFVIQLVVPDKIVSFGLKLGSTMPSIRCKVFEDNFGSIELARLPNPSYGPVPNTSRSSIIISVISWPGRKIIFHTHVSTAEQVLIADFATKPLTDVQFKYLRRKPNDWTWILARKGLSDLLPYT